MFSPSGKSIAFSSNLKGSFDVYTINVDGSGLKVVTDDQGRDIVLDWQRGNAPLEGLPRSGNPSPQNDARGAVRADPGQLADHAF